MKILKYLHKGFKLNADMTRTNAFVQKFDPVTGAPGWVMTDQNYDFHQEIACSMYADMLHDTDRNIKYYAALKKAIDKKHSLGQKANVLDIGTGTGLLSMMAAVCNADSIVACEAFPPIANIAKKVIQDNKLTHRIKIVSKRSTELKVGKDQDLEFKANILVTEVFDTELIGEGAIETFNHANENLLEEDAIIIPWLGKLFVVPLQSSFLTQFNRINSNFPLNNGCIKIPFKMTICSGNGGLHDLQLSQGVHDDFKIMSEPIHIFDFSFNQKIKNDRTKEIEFKCNDGKIDCFAMYWSLDMDQDGETIISCAPSFINETPWRDHWMQAVYHLPQSVQTFKNQSIKLIAQHDQYSHNLHIDGKTSWPFCDCVLHSRISRTRLYTMNDLKKWTKYLNIIKTIPKNAKILYIGDISLLPLIAAKSCAYVECVFENIFSFKIMESIIKENQIENIVLHDCYEHNFNVDYVLSEPYFTDSILPWDGIKVWNLGKKLAPNAIFLPSKLNIMGVAMEFEHLHKIKEPLKNVEGFNMNSFDQLIQRSSELSFPQIDAQPLWEYPGKFLSEISHLMEIDLNTKPDKILSSGEIKMINSGKCHGMALWAEWDFETEIITTGYDNIWDPGTKQGVYFTKPTCISSGTSMDYKLLFIPQIENIEFQFSFPQL